MWIDALLLLAASLGGASGHPGGIRDGRASCGREFNSPASAFSILDVTEAWYLRRIATCDSPFFWNTFSIVRDSQQVYIAAISAEISRFEDRLDFNAVLFGPGLPELDAAARESLPAGLDVPEGLGARILQSPESLAECGFVDQNQVMRRFSDVLGGRCMEDFEYDADYKDPMVASATFRSWWLYSHDQLMADRGDYYLASWLTERGAADATTPVTGRYEITLGPWTWSGYADDATTNLTQSQVTTCTCAANKIAYTEQNLDRISGGVALAEMFADALPYQVCTAGAASMSSCAASEKKALASAESAIEFAGRWALQPGATYGWAFRAYHPDYEYPDASMDVFVKACASLEETESEADAAMMASAAALSVHHGGEIALDSSEKQTLHLQNESTLSLRPATTTDFTFQSAVGGSFCFFTQHRPEEFQAMHFTCTSSAEVCGAAHIFAEQSMLYGEWDDRPVIVTTTMAADQGNGDDNHETNSSANGQGHDDGDGDGDGANSSMSGATTIDHAKVVRPAGLILFIVHAVVFTLAST